MRYLSVCSGIEAASIAWSPLGFEAVAFSEIEAFPCAVLKHHYPNVSNWGDALRFKEWPDATFDLLVGGTPCQSFSVAGLRKGLDDPRGSLMLTYLAIARRYRPRWVVWENVPGVLSADERRALGTFIGGLAELGYLGGWRVLDAQYFGLAQRRARVFVVGHLGDWRRAAAVLFERESLSGHPAPRREAGESVTGTLSSRASGGGGLGTDLDCDGGVIMPIQYAEQLGREDRQNGMGLGDPGDPMFTLECRQVHGIANALRADGFDASEDGTGRGTPIVPIDLRQASRGDKLTNNRAHGSGGPPGHGVGEYGDPAFTVSERGQAIAFSAQIRMQVRRLTPRECERLQGFPDDYTLIPYRGKPAKDGPRYKALGNSMAVPVMRWIGERIQMVEAL